jgi:hypothetical protein
MFAEQWQSGTITIMHVENQDEGGPLHTASSLGHLDIVKALIDRGGADVKAVSVRSTPDAVSNPWSPWSGHWS